MNRVIHTIGHSTRTIDEFIEMLRAFNINFIADVRTYPGSRKFPWFNQDEFKITLETNGIGYAHILSLGGRKKAAADSKNTGWRLAAFRGYADHMQTTEFENGITALEGFAAKFNVAYMCSEAVWWSCHRALISDFLKVRGWTVLHIMSNKVEKEHPFTAPAKVVNGELSYES